MYKIIILRTLGILAAANLMLVFGIAPLIAAPAGLVEPPTAPLLAAPADHVGPTKDLPTAPLIHTAVAPLTLSNWSTYTSEEYPPLTAANGQLISAMACTGSYCDNVYLGYQTVAGVNYTTNSWTTYFSEEGANSRVCGGNSFMTGISCQGNYCDNVSLQCTAVTGKTKGTCKWMPWFSEEQEYSYLDAGYYAAGLACLGSNCDDFSIYACQAR